MIGEMPLEMGFMHPSLGRETLVSLLALTLVGVLYAACTDVSGACGGG